jgi:hypothetical protein
LVEVEVWHRRRSLAGRWARLRALIQGRLPSPYSSARRPRMPAGSVSPAEAIAAERSRRQRSDGHPPSRASRKSRSAPCRPSRGRGVVGDGGWCCCCCAWRPRMGRSYCRQGQPSPRRDPSARVRRKIGARKGPDGAKPRRVSG